MLKIKSEKFAPNFSSEMRPDIRTLGCQACKNSLAERCEFYIYKNFEGAE
jgi:hypothetical protein